MLLTSQRGLWNGHTMLTDTVNHWDEDQSSLSRPILMIWLVGMLILLPVEFFQLPLNVEVADFWILMGLPIVWIFLILERQHISLTYAVPIWLVLVATLLGTLAAAKPSSGVIVFLKESYLFVWFVTLIAVLSRLSARDLRRVMVVWSGVVILHGLLIIAQFLSPEIWRAISRFAGTSAVYEHYRSAGLFFDADKAGSANKAAFFQLLGFVPLLAAKPSKKVATILGILLFLSIVCTGSMGALTALSVGLISALIAIAVLSKQHLVFITKTLVQLAIAASLLGAAYLVIGQYQDKQEHLERIVRGRAEKSSGGRFAIWERGLTKLQEGGTLIWGIGPENFRVVDPLGKQLHNDLLAFVVERGLLGALGLVLFGVIAASRAVHLLLMYSQYPGRPRLEVVVFLAAMAAILFESLTHQIFHERQLWLVLALQEAMLFRSPRSYS